MKIALIMRGIPGSGKSTIAKAPAGEVGVVHSADEYLLVDGRYQFDHTRLEEVHGLNLEAFCRSLDEGVPIVICDNCNIKRAWFEEYVDAAEAAGYAVAIVEMPHPDPEVAAKRNIHGCPQKSIERMIARWES